MSIVSDQSVRRVLEAGLTLFARHGFRRASMADIAREAGVARATLYLHFADKRAVFEALAASLVDDALAGARAAWREGDAFAENLEATILAKDLGFFRLMRSTPHGAELLALDVELTNAHAQRLDDGMTRLLADRAEAAAAAGGADLSPFGGPAEFGLFLALTAAGLKHETRTEADYLAAVRRLCRVTATAARPPSLDGPLEPVSDRPRSGPRPPPG
jgi:AcrR family transcriptional regulator